MRKLQYTQQLEEMQKKRKARILSIQEIIALLLVIAAFAYIIFGLLNRDEVDYYEVEYTEYPMENHDNSMPKAIIETETNYEMYYETP